MAYNVRSLSVLCYANTQTIWGYLHETDSLATILAPEYFSEAQDMLSNGDFIFASACDGGKLLYVSRPKNSDHVTVSVLPA